METSFFVHRELLNAAKEWLPCDLRWNVVFNLQYDSLMARGPKQTVPSR
jgi:hypothetical protein